MSKYEQTLTEEGSALGKMLDERDSTHGDFEEFAGKCWGLWEEADLPRVAERSGPAAAVALAMILFKSARIACGKGDHDDHWLDIAGYAQVKRRTNGGNRPKS